MLVTRSIHQNSYHKKKRQLDYPSTSIPQGQFYIQKYSSINKPLEVKQPTFKGFYNFGKLFKTTTQKVPSTLSEFAFSTLKEFSSVERGASTKQHEIYTKITGDFIERVKTDSSFRKKLKLSDEWADKISHDHLPYLPQKAKLVEFVENLVSPITAIFNSYKPLLKGSFGENVAPSIHKNILKEKEQLALIDKYKGFLGLNNSIKSWENSYRRFSGNPYWRENEQFLIPKDVLFKNIQSSRPKVTDPSKGKYSTKSLMLGNRLISGMIYAVFLSTDAFNTTMRFSGDKDQSNKQQKSRFAQENARIGLNLYLQNVIFSTFEASMNKSLVKALLASGATVALSEIVGRQLVSKPIMPSDKKTLDAKEQEMMSKTGFLPALGRLMTRVKKTDKPVLKAVTSNLKPAKPDVKIQINKGSANPFSSFNSDNLKNQIAFTGKEKVAQIFEAEHLKKLLNVIEKFDSTQYKYYKETIEQGLVLDKKHVDLETFINANPSVPVGDKLTTKGKIMHSVFAPYYWAQGWAKSITKTVKGFSSIARHKELNEFVKKNSFEPEYKEFLEKRLSLPAWQRSELKLHEKETKILQEFVENKNKIKGEIQGTKNVLLWLDKQVKANKFDLSKLTDSQREVLEKSLEKSMILSDSSKHLEYDGNTLSQLNIHLARVITTIFLVTDAYNLTMQYSNDNKKEAQKSAKDRAVQEITRISVSAYMLGFIHNLLSKVCNSSLVGAFTVTALTSIVNDSLARVIVGAPLTKQTQEQIKKHDEKKAK